MSFFLRPSIATRSPHSLIRDVGDNVRLWEDDDVLIIALAAGSEGGFSAYWAPASRLALELFERGWKASTGGPDERLGRAFEHVGARFAIEANERFGPPSEDSTHAGPGANLLAVAITASDAHAAWIGGDVAFLARDAAIAERTTPHTLREDYKAEPEFTASMLDELPRVATRWLTTTVSPQPSTATFRLRAGDVLVVASKAAAAVEPEIARAALAAATDPATLAERLADVAFAREPLFGCLVVVPFAPST